MKTGAVSSQWYAFATVVLWSSAFVFTKVALLSFSSTALGFLRCAIASVVLYAVLRCKGVRMLNWRELPRFTLSGALKKSEYDVIRFLPRIFNASFLSSFTASTLA